LANTLRRHFSRADADLSGLPKVEQIASTHGVELGRWESHVVVPPARRDGLAEMSRHHPDWASKWSKSSPYRLQADLQLWDFGGQEIYHQTHRAFAGVGTVYVLVWRPKLTLQELEDDYHAEEQKKGGDWDCLKPEWLDQNRQHPVRYWVEYLTTLKDLKIKVEGDRQMFRDVVIVCPQTSASEGRPLLEQELEGDQLLNKIDRNQCFYFDSRDPAAAQNSEYQRFVECLRQRAGEVASEQSLVQPKVYEKAVDYVEDEIASIHRNRRERGDVEPQRCLRTVDDWQQQIIAVLQPHADKPLEPEDVESITSYLDACGKVLTLRGSLKLADRGSRDSPQATQRHIVVDINWILENVYSLLSRSASSGSLYQKIKKNQGRVPIEMLRSHSTVRGIDETGARPLLDFMEQCGILVPLSARAGAREYLATERSLLPPWNKVAQKCEAAVETLQTAGPVGGWEISFPRSRLCEFDVRPILGRLGRMFGENSVFFQDGMQAQGTGKDFRHDEFDAEHLRLGRGRGDRGEEAGWAQTQWLLRIGWESAGEDSMLGILRAGLLIGGPKKEDVCQVLVKRLAELPNVGQLVQSSNDSPGVFVELALERHQPANISAQTGGNMLPTRRVFISYSQDSAEHNQRVKRLADWLRDKEGIESWLDQYVENPPQGWPQWMLEQIEQSQYVIVAISERYLSKFREKKRTGVRFESVLILQDLYDAGMWNEKFIPVIFEEADQSQIPSFLKPSTYYKLINKEGFEKLSKRIHGLTVQPPPVNPKVIPATPPSANTRESPLPWESN
jgi:hypothetical protein